MKNIFVLTIIVAILNSSILGQTQNFKLKPRSISLSRGKFSLKLAEGFEIAVAAQGLKRVRFMARSPDDRIFVTDMHSLADNRKGIVYILDNFDAQSRTFKRIVPFLTGLRNPNSIAFDTDENGNEWFYLALTDRLLRYKYVRGQDTAAGEPQVLATFPDYGLGYKYGGWHLTRTVVIGSNHKLYVSVGSSCNACEEKESVRASIIEMDTDGKNQRHFARGMRNAVGMRWLDGHLFVTNMGADHLGDAKPADTFYEVKDGANYGWPYCYQWGSRILRDEKYNPKGAKLDCRTVPLAYRAFDAHSSPLGFEFFPESENDLLGGTFLVALHGSTKKRLKRGYRVVAVHRSNSAAPEDFISGFQESGRIYGRPADLLRFGKDSFLLTDDRAGVVYFVYKK